MSPRWECILSWYHTDDEGELINVQTFIVPRFSYFSSYFLSPVYREYHKCCLHTVYETWLLLYYYPPANGELKLFGAFKSPHSQFICCLYSQFSYLAQLQRLSYRCMIAVLKQKWSCRLLALWCYVFANPVICSSTEFSVCFLLNLIV